MTLIPIGQFSQMTRLSLKALHLYDKSKLLPPAKVDPASGYRYYELGQANRAEAIRILRSLDMPLEEIQLVIDADGSDLARQQLLAHRERLANRLAADERMLEYLESLLKRKEGIMPYKVQTEDVAPQLVAGTKIHTTLRRIGDDIAVLFGRLVPALAVQGIEPSGAPLIVYHDVIDEETDGYIEVCVPINRAFSGSGDVYSRELDGGAVAFTVHHGRYQEIAPAYHTLTGWIAQHGHEICGPPREIYLNDPQMVKPDDLLTRVEFPIQGSC